MMIRRMLISRPLKLHQGHFQFIQNLERCNCNLHKEGTNTKVPASTDKTNATGTSSGSRRKKVECKEAKDTEKWQEGKAWKDCFIYRKFYFMRKKYKKEQCGKRNMLTNSSLCNHNDIQKESSSNSSNSSNNRSNNSSSSSSSHAPISEWDNGSSSRDRKNIRKEQQVENDTGRDIEQVEIRYCKDINRTSIKQKEQCINNVDTLKNSKDVKNENKENVQGTTEAPELNDVKQEIENCNEPNEFLTILYTMLKNKTIIDKCIKDVLSQKMNLYIKTCNDIQMVFLLLYTLNKLMCTNNLIKMLHERIYKVEDAETVSIILRILINCSYFNKPLFSFLLDKLKDSINLHICTTLTISNTIFSYSILYKRSILQLNEIPLQGIIQIISDHYSSFSDIQLWEIISCLQHFKFRKEKTEKDLYRCVNYLFAVCGDYFINKEIVRRWSFKQIKKIIYSYAKNKIYHEKLFLFLYPFLLSHIKKYNKDAIRYKWKIPFNNINNANNDNNVTHDNNATTIYEEIQVDDPNELDESEKVATNNKVQYLTTTNVINKNDMNLNTEINDAIQNVCDTLYAFSKFHMYIDELYNEILLFLHNFYKYIDCSNLSQCLISLTKVNCNIKILLSKIHHDKFHTNLSMETETKAETETKTKTETKTEIKTEKEKKTQTDINIVKDKTWNYFKYAHSTDLINFLLSFSRNLYFEKEVYDILSKLLQKKLVFLEPPDLINIVHAYSKVYYVDEHLFFLTDKILCSKLESDPDCVSVEMAMKYLNGCAKLSYKNEKLLYKMVEIIHKTNFVDMKIYDLFHILKSTKQLGISFDNLEQYIKTIVSNYNIDFSRKNNFYYKTEKEMHMRRKKWVW